jgi:hypothetical protein
MSETCNSFHESGGMRCARPKGHEGRCWCKWSPLTGSPGYVTRGEWTMRGGFFHLAYVQRRASDPVPCQHPRHLVMQSQDTSHTICADCGVFVGDDAWRQSA